MNREELIEQSSKLVTIKEIQSGFEFITMLGNIVCLSHGKCGDSNCPIKYHYDITVLGLMPSVLSVSYSTFVYLLNLKGAEGFNIPNYEGETKGVQ